MKFLKPEWRDCPLHCWGVDRFCPMCHNGRMGGKRKTEKVKKDENNSKV